MHFLPDVYVTCEVCQGKRYNEATLRVKWKGQNIAEVLETSVAEALELFAHHRTLRAHPADARRRRPRLHRARPAGDHAVGRRGAAHQAVARAGQARHRAARSTCSTSRPPACTSTTSSSCCTVLDRLVDAGNTVLVIEHNLDVIKTRRLGHRPRPRGRRARRRGDRRRARPRGRRRWRGSYTGQFLARCCREGGSGRPRDY